MKCDISHPNNREQYAHRFKVAFMLINVLLLKENNKAECLTEYLPC
jgi:hypothetical protein